MKAFLLLALVLQLMRSFDCGGPDYAYILFASGDQIPPSTYKSEEDEAKWKGQAVNQGASPYGQLTTASEGVIKSLGTHIKSSYQALTANKYAEDAVLLGFLDKGDSFAKSMSAFAEGMFGDLTGYSASKQLSGKLDSDNNCPRREKLRWLSRDSYTSAYRKFMEDKDLIGLVSELAPFTSAGVTNDSFVDLLTAMDVEIRLFATDQNKKDKLKALQDKFKGYIPKSIGYRMGVFDTELTINNIKIGAEIKKTRINHVMAFVWGSLASKQDCSSRPSCTLPVSKQKLAAYATTPYTIYSLLMMLEQEKQAGETEGHLPSAGAHIIFELHKMSPTEVKLKILYSKTATGTPNVLTDKLQGCSGDMCDWSAVQTAMDNFTAVLSCTTSPDEDKLLVLPVPPPMAAANSSHAHSSEGLGSCVCTKMSVSKSCLATCIPRGIPVLMIVAVLLVTIPTIVFGFVMILLKVLNIMDKKVRKAGKKRKGKGKKKSKGKKKGKKGGKKGKKGKKNRKKGGQDESSTDWTSDEEDDHHIQIDNNEIKKAGASTSQQQLTHRKRVDEAAREPMMAI